MRGLQPTFPKGKVVGNRYIIEALLGTGGFGAVYRVRDRRVKGNVFALKEVVNPNVYERNSFAFEGDILKRLDHAALPRVYRVLDERKHNRVYMLMDYIDGPNLESLRLQQPERRFPLSQVMKILAPIIDAVAYLHAQQPPIIHRDIKPANIIVPEDDGGTVLVDFGIAKEYEQDSTTTAVRHCSPGYGAPEHYARGTNTRTDIYSLAATFYTLLTGDVPIDALHRMTWMSSKGVDPLKPVNELVPAIPVEVADVLKQALAINSNDRFATVEEFWQALKDCPIEEEAEAAEIAHTTISEEAEDAEEPEASVPVLASIPFTPPLSVNTSTPVVSLRKDPQTRRIVGGRAFLLCLIILTGLVAGLAYGANSYIGASFANNSVPTPTLQPIVTATVQTPVPSPTVVRTPTPQQTPTPQPAVTPVPTATPLLTYPVLAEGYYGTINNQYTTPSTNSSMSLSRLKQDGAAISGYFAVGAGLVGSGDFTGTITTDKRIQFLVPSYGGLLPLFFDGRIAADGSLSGTYCSYQNDRCNYEGGGHGSWNVSP